MQRSDSRHISEWRNELYLDRWIGINRHTNDTGVNNDDDVYGHRNKRQLQ